MLGVAEDEAGESAVRRNEMEAELTQMRQAHTHLRQELERRNMFCFNPRGRALKDIPEVARALGLILECLDPAEPGLDQGPLITNMAVTNTARHAKASSGPCCRTA